MHCIAYLNEDVGAVLPYLNSVLGGTQFLNDPPEVMFHHLGRIIKVGAREIAVNALKDEQEADRILEWLKENWVYIRSCAPVSARARSTSRS